MKTIYTARYMGQQGSCSPCWDSISGEIYDTVYSGARVVIGYADNLTQWINWCNENNAVEV